MTPELLGRLVSIGLIVIVVLFIIGLIAAAFIGYKRGFWKSTYYLVGFAIMVTIALTTLKPLVSALFNANLGSAIATFGIPFERISFSVTIADFTWSPDVAITSVSDTLKELVDSFLTAVNSTYSNSQAVADIPLVLVESILKYLLFVVEILLIETLGMLFMWLMWIILFKRLVPKVPRKELKLKWLSLGETVVLTVVSVAMLVSPFSALVNAVNQGYQKGERQEKNSEIINYVNESLDAYNNSLFAKVFLNWTVSEKTNNLTLDSYFISKLTNAAAGDAEANLIETVYQIGSLGNAVVGVLDSKEGQLTFNLNAAVSEGTISALFTAIKESGLLMSVLPVAASIAVNSDLLRKYISSDAAATINMESLDWENELSNVQNMITDIINSGVASSFIDEEGNLKKFDAGELIDKVLEEETFNKISASFTNLNDSDFLNFALGAGVQYLTSSNEQMAKYLPSTWEDIKDIKWGTELNTLLDCVYDIYELCPEIKDVLVDKLGGNKASKHYKNNEEESSNNLVGDIIGAIASKLEDVKKIIVGPVNTTGNDIDSSKIDSTTGKTNDNSKCLFDLDLLKTIITKGLPEILSGLETFDDAAKEQIKATFQELSNETWRANFKKEFAALFYSLEPMVEDENVLEAVKKLDFASLIPSDLATIQESTCKTLAKALRRMDGSKLINGIVFPLIEKVITGDSVMNSLTEFGLSADLVKKGVKYTHEAETPHFFAEVAKLIEVLPKVGGLVGSLTGSDPIGGIGASSENFAYVLDAFYNNEIINPAPKADDTFTKNANFLAIIDYVFNTANMTGLSFKDELRTKDIKWTNTYDENGNITKFDGETGAICNVIKSLTVKASDDTTMLDAVKGDLFGADMNVALSNLENKYHISNFFTAVGDSYVFSYTMGEFLDQTLASANIIDAPDVSFTNIKVKDGGDVNYWEEEGKHFAKLLTTIGEIDIKINDLSLSALDDVVGFNKLLHALADSDMFSHYDVDTATTTYTFPKWMYGKLASMMGNIGSAGSNYKLLDDPVYWESAWGEKRTDVDYTILYNDMTSLDSKSDWIGSTYNSDTTSFAPTDYYKQPNWYTTEIENFLKQDRIGSLVRVVHYASVAMNGDMLNLSKENFNGMIDSINETGFLRICTYNLYTVAKSAVGGTGSFFNLDAANPNYVIDCGLTHDKLDESIEVRKTELGYLKNLYALYRDLTDGGKLSGGSLKLADLKTNPELVDQIENVYLNLNQSYVFHLDGPDKDATGVAKYATTAFQEMMNAFIGKTAFKDMIYNANNPKDSTSTNYTDGATKADYIIATKFSFANAGTTEKVKQQQYITEMFNVFDKVVDLGVDELDSFDFSKLDEAKIDGLQGILETLDESEILYDCVPNILYNSFASCSFSSFGGLSLADGSPFYRYTAKSAVPNYEIRFIEDKEDDNEVKRIFDILRNFNEVLGDGSKSFTDLSVLSDVVPTVDMTDSGATYNPDSKLGSLLESLYASEVFHKKNQYVKDATHLTVFEQIINTICTESSLVDYTYGSDTTTIKNKIKAITADEIAGNSTSSSNGYHVSWGGSTEYVSEIKALTKFLGTATSLLGTSGNLDMSDLKLDKISPTKLNILMNNLNRVDIFSDVLPKFIQNGFSSVGLSDFTTYLTVDHAYYSIGQYAYGGTPSEIAAGTLDNTDIRLLVDALGSMAKYDGDSNFTGYGDLSAGAEDLMKGPTLPALLKFVVKSHILNTDADGNFNTYWHSAGLSVIDDEASTRGLFLYNLLDKASIGSDSLASYITGSTATQRIYTLSHMLSFDDVAAADFDSAYEASGISNIMNNTDKLNSFNTLASATMGAGYIDGIISAKDSVSFLMSATYTASTSHRSYLLSDIVSSVLNKVLENEETRGFYYITRFGPVTPVSGTTNRIVYTAYTTHSVDAVNMRQYLAINAEENLGFQGGLELVAQLSNFSMPGNQYSDSRDATKAALNKIGTSKVGATLYIAESHQVINQPLVFATASGVASTNCGVDYSLIYESGFTFSTAESTNYGYKLDAAFATDRP